MALEKLTQECVSLMRTDSPDRAPAEEPVAARDVDHGHNLAGQPHGCSGPSWKCHCHCHSGNPEVGQLSVNVLHHYYYYFHHP